MAREAQTVTVEEAAKQQAALLPKPNPSGEPPRGVAPGSHPLVCIEDDPAALAAYRGETATPPAAKEGLWHRNVSERPVFIPGDRLPKASP